MVLPLGLNLVVRPGSERRGTRRGAGQGPWSRRPKGRSFRGSGTGFAVQSRQVPARLRVTAPAKRSSLPLPPVVRFAFLAGRAAPSGVARRAPQRLREV